MTDDVGWGHAEAFGHIINEMAAPEDRGVITKYVVVAETMNEQGGKSLHVYRGPTEDSCTLWDARGMMTELILTPNLFIGPDDA